MRRLFLSTLAVVLTCGCGLALAQSGRLSDVTMRMLDSLEGLEVVIIELPPQPPAR